MKKLIPKYQNGGFTGLMPIMPNTLIKSAFNLVTPLVRSNLYDNLTPVGYSSIPTVVKAAIGIPSFHTRNDISTRDDFWAEYLGIPKEKRHKLKRKVTISPSMYRPTKGKPNPRTFRIDNLSDRDKLMLIENAKGLSIGENKQFPYNAYGSSFDALGRFTVGKGHDSKGTYVSYYDDWNLSPFSNKEVGGGGAEDESFGIGNPFAIYDRIYLDDYYNIPKENRGAYFIPEIEVVANKKASNSQ